MKILVTNEDGKISAGLEKSQNGWAQVLRKGSTEPTIYGRA